MKVRILIIDDEPRWIKFAKSDLSRFEIDVAPDAKTALSKLEEATFDLVITSSKNLDALEKIAERHKEKRVVVTTIQPNTQEALSAYRLGAVRYFAKSFRQEDLLNRVREVIPTSTNQQQVSPPAQ